MKYIFYSIPYIIILIIYFIWNFKIPEDLSFKRFLEYVNDQEDFKYDINYW